LVKNSFPPSSALAPLDFPVFTFFYRWPPGIFRFSLFIRIVCTRALFFSRRLFHFYSDQSFRGRFSTLFFQFLATPFSPFHFIGLLGFHTPHRPSPPRMGFPPNCFFSGASQRSLCSRLLSFGTVVQFNPPPPSKTNSAVFFSSAPWDNTFFFAKRRGENTFFLLVLDS